MIKAIETIYNGYRFRSRMEARWAVFFDTLGIEYQYELEGYELSNGEWYLPDFYLHLNKMWVEVKPKLDIPNYGIGTNYTDSILAKYGRNLSIPLVWSKYRTFTKDIEQPLLILSGAPGIDSYILHRNVWRI